MSLPYNINNEEYRDMTLKSLYPMADNASMNNGIIAIPHQMFLDLLLYTVGEFTAPYYISSIDGLQGNDDQALLTISDYDGQEAGVAWLDRTADMCYIKQGGTIQAGVIVYNQEIMTRFLGELGRQRTVFTPLQAGLAAGQCFSVKPNNITAIQGDEKTYTGSVDILADQGVNFETYVDGGGDDVLVINLYGESTVHPDAVLSINNYKYPEGHVWFAAHPDSALRVLPDGGGIQVAHKQDIGYGK